MNKYVSPMGIIACALTVIIAGVVKIHKLEEELDMMESLAVDFYVGYLSCSSQESGSNALYSLR